MFYEEGFRIEILFQWRDDMKKETSHSIQHYDDVTMGEMASQITSLMIVCSIVYSGADQRKHQSPASLAFVREIHRGPVNSPRKWPVTLKIFPFDDVIMKLFITDRIHYACCCRFMPQLSNNFSYSLFIFKCFISHVTFQFPCYPQIIHIAYNLHKTFNPSVQPKANKYLDFRNQ